MLLASSDSRRSTASSIVISLLMLPLPLVSSVPCDCSSWSSLQDIVGVTRPEAGNAVSGMPSPMAPQAVMAQAKYFRSESVESPFSPVEGEEKVIGATVSMKVRF